MSKLRIIPVLMLVALPCTAFAQSDSGGTWFASTSVMYLVGGPHKGELWTEAGGIRKVAQVGDTRVLTRVAAARSDEDAPTSLGAQLIITDPIILSGGWLELALEFGGANQIAMDEEGNGGWGFIGGAGILIHLGKRSNIYIGGRLFQDAPGKLERGAIGGGATLDISDLMGLAL